MPSGERTKFCLQKTHLQKHGKVADKKSRACVQRYQRRLLIREATRLMKTITLKSNVITALEGPSHLSPGVATKEKKLSELTQQINEARAEHATLLERKNELLSDTTLHKGFLETIKHNVSKLEDQVLFGEGEFWCTSYSGSALHFASRLKYDLRFSIIM